MLEKLLLTILTTNGSESMLNDKQMKKILSSVIASTMTQMPITV